MKDLNKYKKKLNEEVNLKGNKGIPDNFMDDVKRNAEEEHMIQADSKSDDVDKFKSMIYHLERNSELLTRDSSGRTLSNSLLNERFRKLEDLAKSVIYDEFGDILEASIVPIIFDCKIVTYGNVIKNTPDLKNVPIKPEFDKPKDENKGSDDDKDGNKDNNKDADKDEKNDNILDDKVDSSNLSSSIDKKKILNMITQGAGKTTKDIIKYSEVIKDGLKDIFGDKADEVLYGLKSISDIADALDWTTDINAKSKMMKDIPVGLAGTCQVLWESHGGNEYDLKLILEKEVNKIIIKVVALDFAMLIHEMVKGLYLYLQSSSIKTDKEVATKIKKATSSFMDESEDFRYGPAALKMLLMFVNEFPESMKYSKMDTRVYSMLAIDKNRAIEEAKNSKPEYRKYLTDRANMAKTDDQFLMIMKSMFSVFDLGDKGFEINKERFEQSLAKREIDKIIKYISNDIESYKKELEEWESEQSITSTNDDDDSSSIEDISNNSKTDSDVIDYSTLSQRELKIMIDDALDNGDYSEVEKIAKYIKENKDIYLNELKKIYESKNKK